MGTSLSGLTPATTFDGLLKVGDNDPLTADLKAISTGDGTDTMLELSTTALRIGGATGMHWNNTNKRLGIGTDNPSATFEVYGEARLRNNVNVNGRLFNSATGKLNLNNLVYIQSNVGIGEDTPTARLHVKAEATQDVIARFQDPLNTSSYVDIKNDSALTDYTGIYWGSKAKIRSKESGTIFIDTSVGVVFADGNAAKTKIYADGSMSIGTSTIPSSTMAYIKGSGATSATTSLLVQNSNGVDVLQTLDNGSVGIGNPANASYRVTMTSGVLRLKDLLFGQTGTASINNTSLLTMKWNGSTGIGISGGGAIDATARLHIKGSGATSATTALLVENSAGTDLLKVNDDGGINFNGNIFADSDYKQIGRNSSNNIRFAGGETRLAIQGTAAGNKFHVYSSSAATSIFSVYTQTQQVGIGNGNTALDSTAKLQVDSTTQGFLPPRMTDAERDAIATPAAGLMIYDTSNNQMNYWNGSTWIAF